MIPKFRAWDKENEKMLVVNNICNLFWDSKFIECYELVSDPKGKREYDLIDHRIDFEDCVLMQSTGLVDVNAQEIFDGDIVRISMRIGKSTTTSIGAVEFDKFEVCFRIRNELGGHYVTMFHVRYFEVIGNIYQNPELLEESKWTKN